MKSVAVFTAILLSSGLLLQSNTTSRNAAGSTNNTQLHQRLATNGGPDGPVGRISIVIDKSDYELSVFDEKGWYATFPVVFGNNNLDDKKYEGDKNTPEGSFHITNKKLHEKWNRFMGLDYPTKESWDKFNLRKQRGEIPAKAGIGGSIGIHGTWPREDFMVDRYKNWTMGCISMKNEDMNELYSYTPSGTEVTIRK